MGANPQRVAIASTNGLYYGDSNWGLVRGGADDLQVLITETLDQMAARDSSEDTKHSKVSVWDFGGPDVSPDAHGELLLREASTPVICYS